MSNKRCAALAAVALLITATACGMPDGEDAPSVRLRPGSDLLGAGSVVASSEALDGDVMLAGGDVTFDGSVGGSYLGAGGSQHIRGRIEGSARAAGGTVELDASVGRNVTLAGGRVVVGREAVVEHNAYLAGGSVDVDGVVGGDLYAGADEVVIRGRVDGDVRVEARALRLGPDARVGGELRYRAEADAVTLDPGSEVAGGAVALDPRPDEGPPIGLYVFRLLAFLATGAALLALLPGAAGRTVDDLRSGPAAAFGTGLLWVVLAPLAFLLLLVTVVGAPLALMFAAVCVAAMYVAPVVPAVWLGEVLRSGGADDNERERVLIAFLIGGPLLGIAMLLPWVGFVARIALGLIGIGAIVVTIAGRAGRSAATGGTDA